jgi:ABC-type transporter Mla MlaB component
MKNFLRRKREHPDESVEDNSGDKRDMASTAVTCGDVLDISVVAQKYAEFTEIIEKQEAIEISAGELQRIDGAGIQLLVALFNQAEQQGLEITWKDTSESLMDAASLLGVNTQLHLG